MRHGTRTCYQSGCRRPECVAANRKYHTDRYLGIIDTEYVQADIAKARVTELLRVGMSLRQIQLKAGIDYATLKRVTEGKRIQVSTQRAILAIKPSVSAWCYIDSTKSTELVRRMAKQGYSLCWIAEQVGMSETGVRNLNNGTRKIRAKNARAIRDLAEFVGDSPGIARDGLPNGRRACVKTAKMPDQDPIVSIDFDRALSLAEVDSISGLQDITGILDLHRLARRGTCKLSTVSKLAGALHVREQELIA